ncbi:MAG: hypothetical protein KKF65_00505 [Nanoarchaeota archaeon]|nr:hypothetical protein [Nanoarchaeota archaeon]
MKITVKTFPEIQDVDKELSIDNILKNSKSFNLGEEGPLIELKYDDNGYKTKSFTLIPEAYLKKFTGKGRSFTFRFHQTGINFHLDKFVYFNPSSGFERFFICDSNFKDKSESLNNERNKLYRLVSDEYITNAIRFALTKAADNNIDTKRLIYSFDDTTRFILGEFFENANELSVEVFYEPKTKIFLKNYYFDSDEFPQIISAKINNYDIYTNDMVFLKRSKNHSYSLVNNKFYHSYSAGKEYFNRCNKFNSLNTLLKELKNNYPSSRKEIKELFNYRTNSIDTIEMDIPSPKFEGVLDFEDTLFFKGVENYFKERNLDLNINNGLIKNSHSYVKKMNDLAIKNMVFVN